MSSRSGIMTQRPHDRRSPVADAVLMARLLARSKRLTLTEDVRAKLTAAGIAREKQVGCLLVVRGSRTHNGYARIRNGSKLERANRVAFRACHGPLPPEAHACHVCDAPACIESTHLFAGSHADNAADRERKNRGGGWKTRGEAHGCAKLTVDDVLEIRSLFAAQRCDLPTELRGSEHWRQGQLKRASLAARFGISRHTIRLILLRNLWAWLERTPVS